MLLRWCVQTAPNNVIIFKSTDNAHLCENLSSCDIRLSDEDLAALAKLPQRRQVDGSQFVSKEGPYKTLAELWDESC